MKLDDIRARLQDYQPTMAPRPPRGDDIDTVDWQEFPNIPAAVLVPIVARTRPTVLFTKRNAAMRQHAGQVAFPGGRIDAGEDAVAAALREAEEETAMPRADVDVLTSIDDYATGTGFRVTPVIAIVPPDLPLVPSESEVEALFEVPLDHLLDPANHERRTGEWKGRRRTYYVIPWHEHDIWGATAAMVVNLARVLGSAA